ncbi:MAG: glycoside hydrolase family 3 C-terminal domain-containing protein [Silvibacterium sp.]|nr:glycoside hydrolase family 3 C-terminal domain-containing protein [Silvibacterium sp.]
MKIVTALAGLFLSAATLYAQTAVPPEDPAIRSRVDAIISKMSLEEKIDYIGGTGFAIRAMPDLHLPAFEMSDGPYGVRSNLGFPSTTYAVGIGLAASWDPELGQRVGAGIGTDARARGIHYMLGPGVNIYRSPRNGRNFEYFGEDPFLSGAIDVGYVQGIQQQGVSATVKHFLGNNSEFLRHDSDSIIDERTLREIYEPAFEAAVRRGHVGAIMDSYNLTNGQHMTQNGYFNTDVARKQWGFNGVMMSDWVATYDGVAAANGGLDLEMPTGAFMNRKNLLPAVKAGTVTEATLDDKIRHILETAARFGWLDRDQADLSLSTYNGRNQQVALDAAREGAVLLKNDGKLLPLDKGAIRSILVVGPDAWPGVAVGGGSAGVRPFHLVSDLEGIQNYLGPNVTVFYDRGLPSVVELARSTEWQTAAEGGKRGVKVELFNNPDLSGTPTSTTTLHVVNDQGMSWETLIDDPATAMALFTSGAKTQKSRRWTGYYRASSEGPYEIVLEGPGEGGGNRLYLDDKLIFDNWKIVRAFQPHTTVQLSAGAHKIVVEDYQNGPIGGKLRVGVADQRTIVSAKAKTVAAKADAVVLAVGFDNASEGEGGDRTFDLPVGQDELIREVSAANPKTILVVTSGGNVDSTAWSDRVPAWLETWYSGEAGGTALAEILFGDVNPSGHLPATFERRAEDNPTFSNYYPEGDSNKVSYKEGIFVGYRGYEHNGAKPLFPFGYGLSYTTFDFANLKVAPSGDSSGLNYTVTFDVTNTGSRPGATVAQIYVAEAHASVPRPPKELKGFQRVMLQPGETKHVTLPLNGRSFAFYDTGGKRWQVDSGEFGILVGDSSANLPLKSSITISEAQSRNAVE